MWNEIFLFLRRLHPITLLTPNASLTFSLVFAVDVNWNWLASIIPSLVYLVATVNGKLPLFSWQNSNEKICIWVSRILLKRKACCKQGKYIILRVPQNKMGAWFGHLRSLGKVSRHIIYLKLITRQGSFPSSEKEDTVKKQYLHFMNMLYMTSFYLFVSNR